MSQSRDIMCRGYAIFTGGGKSNMNLPHNSRLNVVPLNELTRNCRLMLRCTSSCWAIFPVGTESVPHLVDRSSKCRARAAFAGPVAFMVCVDTQVRRGRGGGPIGPTKHRAPLRWSLSNDPCINTAAGGSIARALQVAEHFYVAIRSEFVAGALHDLAHTLIRSA